MEMINQYWGSNDTEICENTNLRCKERRGDLSNMHITNTEKISITHGEINFRGISANMDNFRRYETMVVLRIRYCLYTRNA